MTGNGPSGGGADARGVALGGFMGTGKSTVGQALAARLGLPFVDVDAVLAERFGPIPDQIALGEPTFRARERAVIAELAGARRVIATGGGAWVDPRNREALAARHDLVVLTASLPVLRARVGDGAGRPLWARAEALLAERAAAYAIADLHVDTDARTVDAVVEEVLRWRHG